MNEADTVHDPALRGHVGADVLVARARTRIQRLTPRAAARAVDAGAVLVDLRPDDLRQRDGEIPDATPVSRHVLEWRLDPSSPDRLPVITGPDTPIVLVCTEGYASSLAAEVCTHGLGLTAVSDVTGGVHAWREAGLPLRQAHLSPDVDATGRTDRLTHPVRRGRPPGSRTRSRNRRSS